MTADAKTTTPPPAGDFGVSKTGDISPVGASAQPGGNSGVVTAGGSGTPGNNPAA